MTDSTSIAQLPKNGNITLETKEKPPPQLSQKTIDQIVHGLQSASSANVTQLPSRDIPMQTMQMSQDRQVIPNYVPEKQKQVDYVQEQANIQNIIHQHQVEAEEKKKKESVYDEFQAPVFVAMLYFLFQMPFLQKLSMKIAPSLFSKDGNPTMTGFFVKALVFGLLFYGVQKSTSYLSEI